MSCVPECRCHQRYGPIEPKPMTMAEWRAHADGLKRLVASKMREEVLKRYPPGPWPFQRVTPSNQDTE